MGGGNQSMGGKSKYVRISVSVHLRACALSVQAVPAAAKSDVEKSGVSCKPCGDTNCSCSCGCYCHHVAPRWLRSGPGARGKLR